MTTNNLTIMQNGQEYDLYNLPDGFVIKGNLNISGKGLTSLPDLSKVTIEGYFDCSHMTSLEGSPRIVQGDFRCNENQLTSLKGATSEIPFGSFYCANNKLTSLEGAPKRVRRIFDCAYNELENLDGMPKVIGERFDCSYNKLVSISGDYDCIGRVDCSHNLLESF